MSVVDVVGYCGDYTVPASLNAGSRMLAIVFTYGQIVRVVASALLFYPPVVRGVSPAGKSQRIRHIQAKIPTNYFV